MKKYDTLGRREVNSLKWNVAEDVLPMWVADMDLETAPNVKRDIINRARHGTYGYTIVSDDWYNSIISWWERRHNVNIEKDWLLYSNGVVPAITSSIKRVSNIGDNILTLTPVYDIFFHSIENTGRHVVEHQLMYDTSKYDKPNESFKINFEYLEKQLADPLTTVLLLCNPNNPTGNIWSDKELDTILWLCNMYNVTVICDEIHCDIVSPGYKYNSILKFAPQYPRMIVCLSASKAFNIAGLQTSAVVIPDKHLNDIVNRGLNSDELAEPNAFAINAVVSAFSQESEPWLDRLNQHIDINKQIVYSTLSDQKNCEEIKVIKSNATYLLWIDCGFPVGNLFTDYLYNSHGLYVSSGIQYKGSKSDHFIRLNTACPTENLVLAISKLANGFSDFKDQFLNC